MMFWKKKSGIKIYQLYKEPVSSDKLGVWQKHLGSFTQVVGYSVTGSILLFAPDSKEYLIFYPSMPGNNCKNYGEFPDIAEFEERILKEPSFPQYGLYPITEKDVKALVKILGPLAADEIYHPALDPAIGGSLNLDGFTKGNVFIHSDILGQNRGIE
ncbi:T6SS immunity protein Tdi1 domain-containing protein [Marinicella meishanensis]|uniref:T6SS immunity protein Tdi1 domain-containing protein n=1 Tax=Marinicella meishanensis TaxID=2873263 RepID=UPI001CBFBDF4|nr:T6SS immunity protein Tdi1 domain-containing protein [Marinicella sp. NBU2979]